MTFGLATPPGQAIGNAVGAISGNQLAGNATALAFRMATRLGLSILRALEPAPGEEPTWTLVPDQLDAGLGLPELAGYGRPESSDTQWQSNIVVGSGFGAYQPITTPRGRGPWRRSISALWPADAAGAVAGIFSDPLATRVRDVFDTLGSVISGKNRPPILQFRYGTEARRVWLADVSLSEPFGLTIDSGMLRAIRATFTLIEVGSAKLVQVPRTPFERETTWHVVQPGDTWEGIAGKVLGNPLLGVLIRRINPEIRLLAPDAMIKIFNKTHSRMRAPIQPRSPFWFDSVAANQRITTKSHASARLLAGAGLFTSLPTTLTTVPEDEPTAYDPGTVETPAPAYRAPIERAHDLRRAAARGEGG